MRKRTSLFLVTQIVPVIQPVEIRFYPGFECNNLTIVSDSQHVNAISIIMLQHYANPCYHFLVNPALIILILLSQKCLHESTKSFIRTTYSYFIAVCIDRFYSSSGSLYSKFCWFRTLFKHEFLFYEPFQMRVRLKANYSFFVFNRGIY